MDHLSNLMQLSHVTSARTRTRRYRCYGRFMQPGPEPHSHSWDVRWFGSEALGQEECPCDIKNVDIDVEVVEGAIQSDYWCVTLLLNGKYSSSLTDCERYLIFRFSFFF